MNWVVAALAAVGATVGAAVGAWVWVHQTVKRSLALRSKRLPSDLSRVVHAHLRSDFTWRGTEMWWRVWEGRSVLGVRLPDRLRGRSVKILVGPFAGCELRGRWLHGRRELPTRVRREGWLVLAEHPHHALERMTELVEMLDALERPLDGLAERLPDWTFEGPVASRELPAGRATIKLHGDRVRVVLPHALGAGPHFRLGRRVPRRDRVGHAVIDQLLGAISVRASLKRILCDEAPTSPLLELLNDNPGSELRGSHLRLELEGHPTAERIATGVAQGLALIEALEACRREPPEPG